MHKGSVGRKERETGKKVLEEPKRLIYSSVSQIRERERLMDGKEKGKIKRG